MDCNHVLVDSECCRENQEIRKETGVVSTHMYTFVRYCLPLFVLLSAGAFADSSIPEYVETDLEWSGFIEELGLDKDIKKLLKGVYQLNAGSPPRVMAQVASKVLKDVNKKYKTKISVDDGIHKMCEVLKQKQISGPLVALF